MFEYDVTALTLGAPTCTWTANHVVSHYVSVARGRDIVRGLTIRVIRSACFE